MKIVIVAVVVTAIFIYAVSNGVGNLLKDAQARQASQINQLQ